MPSRQRRPKKLRLSPTTGLNLFSQCPRCFWIHYRKGVHRPRGIFPSLPGGMDLVIKTYFDNYRGSLPPELEDKVDGELMTDLTLLQQWRNWRTGLLYSDPDRGAELFGALDDCMVYQDLFVPLDYKTKGSAPRPGDSEKYYQTQLDTYALLLQENGCPPADFGYLVYYYPRSVGENGAVQFNVEPIKISIDPERARALFERAVDALSQPIPPRHTDCEYCTWNEDRNEFD